MCELETLKSLLTGDYRIIAFYKNGLSSLYVEKDELSNVTIQVAKVLNKPLTGRKIKGHIEQILTELKNVIPFDESRVTIK